MIDSLDKLERAALDWKLLPFFSNDIRGFSVEEMAAPGYIFGDDGEDCWNWKGPVIGRMTAAYGKFFRRKAGFVARDILPYFLNYRRWKYPVVEGSTDSLLLDIIREHEGLSSTELKKLIFGKSLSERSWNEPVDDVQSVKPKKGSLEGALQRLQMGGYVCIVDFQYKISRKGERYGWGVAVYSTPEIWFEDELRCPRVSPTESFDILVSHLELKLHNSVSRNEIIRLLE